MKFACIESAKVFGDPGATDLILLFQHGGGFKQLRCSADWVDDPPGSAIHQHHGGHLHCKEGQNGIR